ncbi:MAG: M20/M25/M40 family metallo-hydrolase [Chloroflexi bacterium]|nr:M20/M25/M40 family metallo-hydrolase [Chloroflexota bacterium]
MKRTTCRSILTLAWLALVALACNLGTPDAPPTLVPRPTETLQPTIGYNTLSPEELPQPIVTAPPADANLANILNRVESDRLFLHVDALQRMYTRHVNSADAPDRGVAAAYRYIRAQFEEIQKSSGGAFSIFDHPFTLNWAGVTTVQYNIVGIIQGKEVGGGIVLVGAHYDSISMDPNDPNYNAPGANDNASGVAALIELARILATRPHRATIMLVAFGAEEVGRKGSIELVKYLQERQIPVNYMINLDIIGSQDGPNGELADRQIRAYSSGPNESPSRQLARMLELINFQYMPSMQVLVADEVDRAGRYGDHMSFSEMGIPAVRLIEAQEEPQRHHTPMDTIEDIEATYLMRSTQTTLAAITVLADGPAPPRNLSLRDTGTGKRTLIWEPSPGAASYIIALRRPTALTYDQQFPWTGTSVEWEGFVSSQFAGLIVVAVDANGLMGPPSPEYVIP